MVCEVAYLSCAEEMGVAHAVIVDTELVHPIHVRQNELHVKDPIWKNSKIQVVTMDDSASIIFTKYPSHNVNMMANHSEDVLIF